MREASEFWERGERMEGGGGREGSEIAEVRAKKRLSEEERERRMIVSMITMERKRKRDGGRLAWEKGMGSNLLALT